MYPDFLCCVWGWCGRTSA